MRKRMVFLIIVLDQLDRLTAKTWNLALTSYNTKNIYSRWRATLTGKGEAIKILVFSWTMFMTSLGQDVEQGTQSTNQKEKMNKLNYMLWKDSTHYRRWSGEREEQEHGPWPLHQHLWPKDGSCRNREHAQGRRDLRKTFQEHGHMWARLPWRWSSKCLRSMKQSQLSQPSEKRKFRPPWAILAWLTWKDWQGKCWQEPGARGILPHCQKGPRQAKALQRWLKRTYRTRTHVAQGAHPMFMPDRNITGNHRFVDKTLHQNTITLEKLSIRMDG